MSLQVLRKGLLRLPSLAARPLRSVSSNPARNPLGPLDIFIGIAVFYGVALIPSGYIMVNLENYRKRE